MIFSSTGRALSLQGEGGWAVENHQPNKVKGIQEKASSGALAWSNREPTTGCITSEEG